MTVGTTAARKPSNGVPRRAAVTSAPVPPGGPSSVCTPRAVVAACVPLVALPELLLVLLGMRTDHSHPHAHDERFLWQTNLFLNLISAYLAFEVASPVVFVLFGKVGSVLLDVGLHCDYACLWSFALACTLPIEFYVASGDVDVPRGYLVLLYVGLLLLLAMRTWLFVDAVRRAVAGARDAPVVPSLCASCFRV